MMDDNDRKVLETHVAMQSNNKTERVEDEHNNSESSRRYSRILRRQTLFFAILSALALFIFIAVSLSNHVTVARYQKIESEIQLLINPVSLALSELIEKDNLAELQQLIDETSNNPFVISANVFTINSELLVSSTLDYKSSIQMRINYVNKPDIRFYLEPIFIANKQVGFLQLQMAYEKMYRDLGIFKLDMTIAIFSLFILSIALSVIILLMFKHLMQKLTQG